MTFVPPPTSRAFTVGLNNKVYLWGGDGSVQNLLYVYDGGVETWQRKSTTGSHPPPELRKGGCSQSGQFIYAYGGSDLTGGTKSGSLFQIDTGNFSWKELSCHPPNKPGPMPKAGCGVVVYKNLVVVFGGGGPAFEVHSGPRIQGSKTNELHCYDFSKGDKKGCGNFLLIK